MGVWWDFLFDNARQQDATEAEKRVREKYPLLLHPNETIILSFKDRGGKGRDKEYFTTHRILIKDGKGVGGKRKNYQSIPYKYIQAFQVETAGKLDGDTELQIWSTGIRYASIAFSSSNVDIFQVQQFLSAQVIRATQDDTEVDAVPPDMGKKQGTLGKIVDWFGDNAKRVENDVVDATFKQDYPILLEHERCQVAFQSGRDFTIFTNLRVLLVDKQGVLGKRVQFQSILWDAVHSYSLQTAGALLDRDMELELYTNIVGFHTIQQDIRQRSKQELHGIMTVLNNHVLGVAQDDPLPEYETKDDQKGFWWFKSNQRPLDAKEMDQTYHSNPPILRSTEHVEMAFKGWRDVTIFTNLRILVVDPKGLIGEKIQYTSIPWRSVVAHAVRTAGKHADFDTEVCIWTEKEFLPGKPGDPESEDNPPEPPQPYVSYFELDFNKSKVNMSKLNYYLSRRLLNLQDDDLGVPIELESLTEEFESPSGVERLWQWMGGDQRELDPTKLDTELHTTTKVLLDDEKVLMAFKAGRDSTIFTNKRVMMLDVQGLTGSKVEYTSIPFKSIYAWDVQTAGMWDRDTELTLYTRNRWKLASTSMDFRTGKADISQLNRFLSSVVIGLPSDSPLDLKEKDYENGNQERNPFRVESMGILDNKWEIDAMEVETKLRSDPCLLLNEEKVMYAFRSGRDIDVFTNRRIIFIDTKGMTGKRTMYKSIPYRYIHGYEFETAGHMDRDAELYLYTNIADVESEEFPRIVGTLRTKQSILVKKTDIYAIGQLFTEHLLFGTHDYAEDPEVDLTTVTMD